MGIRNSYLDDEGGNCTGSSTTTKVKNDVKQKRTCKYQGVTPSTSGGKGPNYRCDSTAITPLTSSRSTLEKAVDALDADGNTNILEGLMWGWRTVSPNAPFGDGRAYNWDGDLIRNRKFIIVMTDGDKLRALGLAAEFVVDNPKFLAGGQLAAWLWLQGLVFSVKHGTSGLLPTAAVKKIAGTNASRLASTRRR